MPVLAYSGWHRWDPHIHTPGTALEDRFADKWDEFFRLIEIADPPVTALGITDYLSLRCYEAFLARRPAGHAPELVFTFPNIEFRLAPRTTKGNAINAHLLVSPEDPSHISRIKECLSRLTISAQGERIACSEAGLIRLGGLHLGGHAVEDIAYAAGVEQFKVDVSVFLKWLDDETWLRRNSLLAIAGGNDGLAGLRKQSGFRQYHDELVRAADLVFSAQPSDRTYYAGLGKEPPYRIEARYETLKPCLHGCDAHELSRVLRPDLDRHCWIKAAPTFDGLRQTLFEPAERVHIGPLPPSGPDPDQIVEFIRIRKHNGWFITEEIPLSSGLSAVIGEKGSGKTALADIIALAADAWDSTESSFLAKAHDHLLGAEVELVWRSGRRSTAGIPTSGPRGIRPEIRYLSQQFVERLCSTDLLADELVREVERVVFEHIPPSDQMNSVDFDDLRRKRTQSLVAERAEIRETLSALNEVIDKARAQKEKLPKKRVELQELETDAARIEKQLKALVSTNASAAAEKIQRIRHRRDQLTTAAAKLQEQLTKTEHLRSKMLRSEGRFNDWYETLRAELLAAGVPQQRWPEFKPTFTGTPLEALSTHRENLERERSALLGGPNDRRDAETIFRLNELLQSEEKKLELDEQRRRQVLKHQKDLAGVRARIENLKQEVASIERWEAEERPKVRERRDAAYARYFQILAEEKDALAALYEPLRNDLAQRETGERDLDFEVNTVVDVAAWAGVGEDMLDLRRSGRYTKRGALEEDAKALLEQAWHSGDAATLKEGLRRIGESILDGSTLKQVLRQGYTPKHISDWLYSVDHIWLEYGLKYRNVPLRLLSPGTRGIVLLILYLAVDTLDDRPLVVDQPEENLDNASVFAVLVRYFREAKRRRQIVVVTHNPNLVVNTDAEEVIIATAKRRESGLPEIEYSYGPLEHVNQLPLASPVKEQVCEILEGGRNAFRSRQRRYA